MSDDEAFEHNVELHKDPAAELDDRAISALLEERTALGQSAIEQAEHIFEEHLPAAALAICKIAIHDRDNKRRLDAAKYVVDRQLGKAVQKISSMGPDDPLLKFIAGVETFANEQGK